MPQPGTRETAQDVVWVDTDSSSAPPLDKTPLYSIGDLAGEYGVTLRALRFYETKGLLRPQRMGGSRFYTEEDRRRLKLIIKGKQLGFTLREIVDMVASGSEINAANALGLTREQCVEQIKLLERQKREIEIAIGELRRTYSSLYEHDLNDCLTNWRTS